MPLQCDWGRVRGVVPYVSLKLLCQRTGLCGLASGSSRCAQAAGLLHSQRCPLQHAVALSAEQPALSCLQQHRAAWHLEAADLHGIRTCLLPRQRWLVRPGLAEVPYQAASRRVQQNCSRTAAGCGKPSWSCQLS